MTTPMAEARRCSRTGPVSGCGGGPAGRAPGPTPGVDLWWSGKHSHHGGNVQVITAPDGWPLWTSPVRPGREHDTTALRTHAEILPALTVERRCPGRDRDTGASVWLTRIRS